MDEVRNGLYYFEALFDLAPEVERRARARGGASTTRGRACAPAFLRFGSWIGGDRDGNPYVTRPGDRGDAAGAQRPRAAAAAPRASSGCTATSARPSGWASTTSSSRACAATPRLFPDEARRAEERYRRQPYRQKLLYVYRRLGATLEAAARPWRADHRVRPGTYADAAELFADLKLLQRGAAPAPGRRLAEGRLGDARARRPRSSASTSRASTCASTARATPRRSPR